MVGETFKNLACVLLCMQVWSATLGGDVRSMSVHGPWLLVATDNEALNGIETTSGRVRIPVSGFEV
jgi:hypothetical protein